MTCRKCGAKMRERVVEPFGLNRPVTLHECRSALCEHDEDEYPGRRRWHERFR